MPDDPIAIALMAKFDCLLSIARAKKICMNLVKVEEEVGDIPYEANKDEWSSMKDYLDELVVEIEPSQHVEINEIAPGLSTGPCRAEILKAFEQVLTQVRSTSDVFVAESWLLTAAPIEKSLDDFKRISQGMFDGSDWKKGMEKFEIDDYVQHASETAFKQKAISAKIKLGYEELERKLQYAETIATEMDKTDDFKCLNTRCRDVMKIAMITKVELSLIQTLKKKADEPSKAADIEDLLDKCDQYDVTACEDLTPAIYDHSLALDKKYPS